MELKSVASVIVAGSPKNPYNLLLPLAPDAEVTRNSRLTELTIEPAGIADKSNVAHPRVTGVQPAQTRRLPSDLVPSEVTYPDL